ncbi:peptidoglycan D,D-transpeptidase FtsI family protein [Cumulibacter manganitolerans]|uniref:peptidoglycan D,D-transpeptidase FtsI family protein n=1 Tax=Cumulibacter manganitolerans TaxID=1884992 RepID=UPI0012953AC6|nr:penicillin-binding protein 2 [Cumulibacter manganitolerans]
MKKPVRKLALFTVILFAALFINFNYLQVVRSESLQKDPGNTRVLLNEYQNQRGSIVVAGNPIAVSEPTSDKLKYLRTYPGGPAYAAVSGYYSIVYGTSGVEKYENEVLAGTDDRLVGNNISDLFSGRDPKGGNVVLTINPAAQEAAFKALSEVTVGGAPAVGGVVAIDPKTGAILALASTPSYDPAKLSTHKPSEIRDYAQSLSDQPTDPRSNQAIAENYPPGSIFKIIDTAAALENGVKPDDQLPAPDAYKLPGTQTTLKNYNGESCTSSGTDTLLHSFTISCNTTFAQLAVDKLGEDKIRSMAEKFGVTDEAWEMPLRVSGSKLGDIIDNAALAQTAIGQRDVRFTVMQGAMLAACIANDGQLMKPYLVAETQAPDLSVLDKTAPEQFGPRAVSKEISDEIKTMMLSVVQKGSGKKAQVPGVDVAGKTGTAQVAEGVNDHTWFTGFAPADDPKIAVAVFIKNGGGTGGEMSAPIAADVIKAYLSSLKGGG